MLLSPSALHKLEVRYLLHLNCTYTRVVSSDSPAKHQSTSKPHTLSIIVIVNPSCDTIESSVT